MLPCNCNTFSEHLEHLRQEEKAYRHMFGSQPASYYVELNKPIAVDDLPLVLAQAYQAGRYVDFDTMISIELTPVEWGQYLNFA